jgi:hypothetical protein
VPMFLTDLLSPSSVLNFKAAGFCQEVLPARFEVVTGLLLILECYAVFDIHGSMHCSMTQ